MSYAVGKQFEQNKYVVSEDLRMAALWATRTSREHSLYDEVNFLSSIQELDGWPTSDQATTHRVPHIWRSHRQMWDIARQRDLHHYLSRE